MPFGTWSNCPYDPALSPAKFCSHTALSNAGWDLNSQTYFTTQTRTFSLEGNILVEQPAFISTPGTQSGDVIFVQQGSSGTWLADPAQNKITLSNPTINATAPYGFVEWGGVLQFSGTPSAGTFVSGTFY